MVLKIVILLAYGQRHTHTQRHSILESSSQEDEFGESWGITNLPPHQVDRVTYLRGRDFQSHYCLQIKMTDVELKAQNKKKVYGFKVL